MPLNSRLFAAILATLSLLSLVNPGQTFAQAPPRGRVPLGLNVDFNEQSFVDMVQPDSGMDCAAGGDARGWPQGDFHFVIDNRYTFAWVNGAVNVDPQKVTTNIGGAYTLTFIGQATLGGSGMTVAHQVHDAATNTTTAKIIIPNPPGGVFTLLQFSQTKRLPTDAPGTGVTDVHLIRPGYPRGTRRVLTDLWLRSIKNYHWSALRFMGALGTNSYALRSSSDVYPYRLRWATDRWLPANGPLTSRVGIRGIPWEYVVLIANQTGKDIWINLPVNASDDYVTQLAKLFKNGDAATGNVGLKRGIHIYVEYSNELWHYGFPQGPWNYRATLDEVKAGRTNLNYDGETNDDVLRFRRIAKRTIEIGQQFRSVFRGDPARIRPVIDNALIDHDVDMLTYVTKNYGVPAKVLYGISQTGYYASADKSSVAAILAGEKASTDTNKAGYVRSRTIATFYGLHSLAYEGGHGESGNNQPVSPVDTGLPNQFAAARDPRMKDVEAHDLLGNWYPSGGELYMQFAHVGRYSTYGMWGLSEDLTNRNTGKWQGMAQVLSAPLPPVTAGTTLPTITGKSVGIPENTTGNMAFINPSAQPWQEILLTAKTAGVYAIMAYGAQDAPGGKLQFAVDNHVLGAASLPLSARGAGISAPAVSVTLTPGLHTLFVYVVGPPRISIPASSVLTITRTGAAAQKLLPR